MAEVKKDGWRTQIERTVHAPNYNRVSYTSGRGKPIKGISHKLQIEFSTSIEDLPLGTILDAEWCSRRPGCRDESLWVFDILKIGTEPLYGETAECRYALLKGLVSETWLVPTDLTPCSYEHFFDFWKDHDPSAEGIVLKRRDSKYIGSFRDIALNPGWIKCKWRAGEDGTTPI